MAATQAKEAKDRNFYHDAMNDPEVLKRREERKKALDAAVEDMLARAPGRVPGWDLERRMYMDRFCLEHGKRCIMWDDEGAGFYLMMHWDWLANRPAELPSPEAAAYPGWWHNIKEMMRPPLLEVALPEGELAAWIDAHTMRVHDGFIEKLHKLRREERTGKLVLDDPYWEALQQLPPLAEQEQEEEAEEEAEGGEAGSAGGEAGSGSAGSSGIATAK
ncbi:hypothetical protein ABPG75_001117 [Micractinium tetrahymenae]